MLKGEVVPTDPALTGGIPLRASPDFSIKPRICLNGGSGIVSHDRSGDITVSFNLNRNYAALFGVNMGSSVKYALKDLRLTFNSVPDDGSKEPIALRSRININQSMQSSASNINVSVPAVCDAVSCSFQVQAERNTPSFNNTVLHQVPNLKTTQWMFNDSTNTGVSYQIRNPSELVDRAINSFVDSSKNSLDTARLANGDGFMIGLGFGELIDLSRQRFSVELVSDVSNLVPLVMFMYFHTIVSI